MVLDDVLRDTVGTDEVYGYRSKLTPHYDRPRKNGGEWDLGAIGFQMKGQRRLVDVEKCVIATEAINR